MEQMTKEGTWKVIYSDPRFSKRQIRPSWEYKKIIHETLVRHYTQGLTLGEINKLTGFPKKKLKSILSFTAIGKQVKELFS